MPTQTHQKVIRNTDGAQVANGSVVKSANTEVTFGSTIANAGNDVYTVALDVSNIVAWWMVSTQIVTVTVNDDGTPDESYVLAANVPLTWHSTDGTANPMTHDWTSAKVANSSGSSATFTAGFLVTT